MIALIFISTFFLVLCPADQQTASQLTSTTPNMAVINYLDWKKCDSKQPFHSMKCQITSWASHLITLPVGYKRASKKEVIWSIWIKGNVQETSRSWQKRNIIFKLVANSRAYLVGVFFPLKNIWSSTCITSPQGSGWKQKSIWVATN